MHAAFKIADQSAGELDAQGLQALAKQAYAETEGEAKRRGPFRPEVWLNARERHTSRLAAHYFRAFDLLAILGLTLLCVQAALPGPLFEASLAQAAPFAIGATVMAGLPKWMGLYGFGRAERLSAHLGKLTAGTIGAGAIAAAVGVALNGSATLAAYAVWTALCLLVLHALHIGWSDLVRRWRTNGALTPNVVLVGATRHAEALIHQALQRRDINVLGVFDDRLARVPDSVQGVPVLGDTNAMMSHKIIPYVDRIVLAVDPSAQARVRELSARLRTLPNEVSLVVDPHGSDERDQALDRLAEAPLAPLDGPVNPERRAFTKRLQDMVLGSVAFALLAPVMALTALAIRLDSPGPILFRQRRHGFNNEEIVVWKFRSMRHEAADATASRQVTSDDDRITRVGRFIRKTSLDELPQLLNVLSGEMSLVGPRPHAIGMKTGQVESARLVAEYARRHRIKPGMTGWAAIKGSRGPLHSAQDVRRRVQLDIDYVERQSFWLDLWIMLVTVPVLLGDRAAIR